MKLVAAAVRFWSTVTPASRARRPSPSPTWCVTPSWVWSRLTRWSSSAVPSFRPTSILWVNCWNSNKGWCDRIRPPAQDRQKRQRTSRRPTIPRRPMATSVQSLLAVTCVICRLRVGPPATNLPLKWNLAVAFEFLFHLFKLIYKGISLPPEIFFF